MTVKTNGEKDLTMNDTKTKSLSEALINSFGGYPIGYGIGIIIFPLSTRWIQEDPFIVTIFITLVYATVSFVRTYFLRRFFEQRGFDDNFIRLGMKMFQKVPFLILKVKPKSLFLNRRV